MKENVSVANNACWAIGEVAVKVRKHANIFSTQQATNYCFLSQNGHFFQVRQEISPIVLNVITYLVPILSNTEVLLFGNDSM